MIRMGPQRITGDRGIGCVTTVGKHWYRAAITGAIGDCLRIRPPGPFVPAIPAGPPGSTPEPLDSEVLRNAAELQRRDRESAEYIDRVANRSGRLSGSPLAKNGSGWKLLTPAGRFNCGDWLKGADSPRFGLPPWFSSPP